MFIEWFDAWISGCYTRCRIIPNLPIFKSTINPFWPKVVLKIKELLN